MGLSIQQLKEYAQLLGKSYDKLTKEETRAAEYALSQGSKTVEENEKDVKKPVDTATTAAGLSAAGPFVDIVEGFTALKNAFSLDGIGKGVDELINRSQELANSMGVGRARADEFRALIADSVPEMIKLGISEEKAMENIKAIPSTLKVNTTLTKESIVEISAASEITKKDAGLIANSFKGVGFNLSDVGDRMAEVANYAKSIGVNVQAVGGKVVENIAKLNTMNFQGGINGLAKMVAQSEMLGVNMEKVLNKAEDLMNPEKAIEFSSALQRLGVQSSALLDPLSAMDMAINNPAALQNEMVKISQQFTRLKADGSGFEILPGAKLQLREVANSLGMSAEELANMSIKSADLEMKMSKIRFPGFAASEEDKMLIANMAQMKDGRAMVTIAKEGGGTEEVDVENLTAEQIDKLKEEQANQNKTAEEIARDQLSVLQDIAAQMKGTAKSAQMGLASTGAVQRMTNLTNELRRSVTSVVSEKITTEGVRGTVSPVVGEMESGIVKSIASGDIMELFKSLANLPEKLTESASGIAGGGIDMFKDLIQKVSFNVQDQYKTISGVKPGETNIEKTLLSALSNIEELGGLFGINKGTETPKTSNLNINQTLEIKGTTDQVTSNMITTAMDSWWNDKISNPAEMNKVLEGMDKSTTGSGMRK